MSSDNVVVLSTASGSLFYEYLLDCLQVQGDQAGQFSLDEFQHFLSVSGEGEGIVDPVFVDHEVRGTVQAANFEQC